MTFKPGDKKPVAAGRKAGTPNRVTMDLIQMLKERGFEPAAALVEKHELAMEDFRRHEANRKRTQARMNKNRHEDDEEFEVTMTDDAREALRLATGAAAQLMQYTHPKRKAIEHTGANGEPLSVKPVVVYIPDNGRK